jgi:hypothetical protein
MLLQCHHPHAEAQISLLGLHYSRNNNLLYHFTGYSESHSQSINLSSQKE